MSGPALADALHRLTAAARDARVGRASDDELLGLAPLLEQTRRAVEGLLGTTLGELERRGTTDARTGHRTAAWFATTTGCARGEAARRVRTGRRVRTHLPGTELALAHGAVSWEHARVLADLATPRNAPIVAALEDDLLRLADVLPFEQWRAEVAGLVDLADPDGGHRPGPESSTLRLGAGFGGSVHLDGTLTAMDGLALREALEGAADRLRLRARDEVERGAREEVPSQAELLAAALTELVRNGCAARAGDRAPVTELTLITHAEDPIRRCRPHRGRPADRHERDLDEPTVRTLCCDPALRAVVIDSLGNPLDVGRRTRLVPPSIRRAVEVRDGGCVFPGCDAPSAWCDLHHVVHWADGGPTSTDNLASLCRHHHGVTHRRGWSMSADPDRAQTFVWTRPDGTVLRSQRPADPAGELVGARRE